MSTAGDPRVLAARVRSLEARAQLLAHVDEAKQRLHPEALASQAMSGLRAKAEDVALDAVDTVRRRPWAIAATAGAIGLFLARKPIAGWIAANRHASDATDAEPTS